MSPYNVGDKVRITGGLDAGQQGTIKTEEHQGAHVVEIIYPGNLYHVLVRVEDLIPVPVAVPAVKLVAPKFIYGDLVWVTYDHTRCGRVLNVDQRTCNVFFMAADGSSYIYPEQDLEFASVGVAGGCLSPGTVVSDPGHTHNITPHTGGHPHTPPTYSIDWDALKGLSAEQSAPVPAKEESINWDAHKRFMKGLR